MLHQAWASWLAQGPGPEPGIAQHCVLASHGSVPGTRVDPKYQVLQDTGWGSEGGAPHMGQPTPPHSSPVQYPSTWY